MFATILEKLRTKVKRHLFGAHRIVGRAVQVTNLPLLRLGTDYGGWTFVPTDELRAGGLAVSCGAGEDISFDIELVRQFRCKVTIVDPTPRAIAHFSGACEALRRGERYPVNRSISDFYDPGNLDIDRIAFVAKAIWNETALLKFYTPRNPAHVSHSLVNLQETESYIEVEACQLSEILRRDEGANLVLIKLDIEGAEHVVIRSFLEEGILPQQILVEFDQLNFPNRHTLSKVRATIRLLSDKGYSFVHFDGTSNCLFVRTERIHGE